jgi:hypothetical protein
MFELLPSIALWGACCWTNFDPSFVSILLGISCCPFQWTPSAFEIGPDPPSLPQVTPFAHHHRVHSLIPFSFYIRACTVCHTRISYKKELIWERLLLDGLQVRDVLDIRHRGVVEDPPLLRRAFVLSYGVVVAEVCRFALDNDLKREFLQHG